MKPRIVGRAAFRVVGMDGWFRPGKVEGIPALWDRFLAREKEVGGAVPGASFGVCLCDPPDPTGKAGFRYLAGVRAAPDAPVPEGMAAVEVPAGTYAVFTVRGPIREFPGAVETLWREWIPASGLKPTGAPDFEEYGDRFRGDDPASEVDVWIPVERPPAG